VIELDDPELLRCSKCKGSSKYHGNHTFPPIEAKIVSKDTKWICETCREDPLGPGMEDCHGCGKPFNDPKTRIECEDCHGYYHSTCLTGPKTMGRPRSACSARRASGGAPIRCRFCRESTRYSIRRWQVLSDDVRLSRERSIRFGGFRKKSEDDEKYNAWTETEIVVARLATNKIRTTTGEIVELEGDPLTLNGRNGCTPLAVRNLFNYGLCENWNRLLQDTKLRSIPTSTEVINSIENVSEHRNELFQSSMKEEFVRAHFVKFKKNMHMMRVTRMGWIVGHVSDTGLIQYKGILHPETQKAVKFNWFVKNINRWSVEVFSVNQLKMLLQLGYLKFDQVAIKPRVWTKTERKKYDTVVGTVPASLTPEQRFNVISIATGCTVTECREREDQINDRYNVAERQKKMKLIQRHELEKKRITLDNMAKKDGPVRMRQMSSYLANAQEKLKPETLDIFNPANMGSRQTTVCINTIPASSSASLAIDHKSRGKKRIPEEPLKNDEAATKKTKEDVMKGGKEQPSPKSNRKKEAATKKDLMNEEEKETASAKSTCGDVVKAGRSKTAKAKVAEQPTKTGRSKKRDDNDSVAPSVVSSARSGNRTKTSAIATSRKTVATNKTTTKAKGAKNSPAIATKKTPDPTIYLQFPTKSDKKRGANKTPLSLPEPENCCPSAGASGNSKKKRWRENDKDVVVVYNGKRRALASKDSSDSPIHRKLKDITDPNSENATPNTPQRANSKDKMSATSNSPPTSAKSSLTVPPSMNSGSAIQVSELTRENLLELQKKEEKKVLVPSHDPGSLPLELNINLIGLDDFDKRAQHFEQYEYEQNSPSTVARDSDDEFNCIRRNGEPRDHKVMQCISRHQKFQKMAAKMGPNPLLEKKKPCRVNLDFDPVEVANRLGLWKSSKKEKIDDYDSDTESKSSGVTVDD